MGETAHPTPPQDWLDWHKPYDDPNSRLAKRLRTVQQCLREAIDGREGELRILSICAGQGRDVLEVLAEHPRRAEISASLYELDPRNAEIARASAEAAGLTNVRVAECDAALTDNYADEAPAEIVLACGIFGNITLDDIENTIRHLPSFCAPGATVLWTRWRRPENDVTPQIRQWFVEYGFEEIEFHGPAEETYSVGANRLVVAPPPIERGARMFTFFR